MNVMYKTEDLLLAQGIEIIFFDVDGVFTDGRIICSDTNESLKQFNVLDGQGIKWLNDLGVLPVVISGRSGKHVEKRLSDLGIKHIYLGVDKKIDIAERVLSELNLDWSRAGVMGDDWADLHMIMKCALSCAPINAHHEVKSRAKYVSSTKGGEGAVRDFCDLIITAKGKYQRLLEQALGLRETNEDDYK